ncbi:hypothetical protein AB6A40_007888 [Gnathostoma spinigerum]|uniref:Glycine-rich protein n=1 Tax=Gnathostoma spinigerum TaxID=75299 RepID=A0ABD6EMJ1_9BILA
MLARVIFCVFFIVYVEHACSKEEITGVRAKRQYGLVFPFDGFNGHGHPFGGYGSFQKLGYGHPLGVFDSSLGAFGGKL